MVGATDAAYERVPLAALLWICRELSGQSERRISKAAASVVFRRSR